jgi:hypothetical protein
MFEIDDIERKAAEVNRWLLSDEGQKQVQKSVSESEEFYAEIEKQRMKDYNHLIEFKTKILNNNLDMEPVVRSYVGRNLKSKLL